MIPPYSNYNYVVYTYAREVLNLEVCSNVGCNLKRFRRGLCGKHYREWLVVHGNLKLCSVDGCEKVGDRKGLCNVHYDKRYGTSKPGGGRRRAGAIYHRRYWDWWLSDFRKERLRVKQNVKMLARNRILNSSSCSIKKFLKDRLGCSIVKILRLHRAECLSLGCRRNRSKKYDSVFCYIHYNRTLTNDGWCNSKSSDGMCFREDCGRVATHRGYCKTHYKKVFKSEGEYKKKYRCLPRVRVNRNMSQRIQSVLKGRKKGKAWPSLVGYTKDDLMSHLEGLFVDGMTWENYGEWHIDHIYPVSKFDFSSYEDEGFKECWMLSNLQPLWAMDNCLKGDRVGVEYGNVK